MRGTAADKICDAMLILLKEKSLDKISVKELTSLARVNRSSYSYHFYCKEDVIYEIFSRFTSGLGTIFFKTFTGPQAHTDIYSALKTAVLNYYKEHLDEIKTVCAAGFEGEFNRKLILTLEELFHQLEYTVTAEDGNECIISSGTEYDMYIKQIVHGMLAAVEYWEVYKFAIPVDDVVSLSNLAEANKLRDMSYKRKSGKIRT